MAFATVLTLVLVPSLLAILNDFRLLAFKLRQGFWPKRYEVEPARHRHANPLEAPEPEFTAGASPGGGASHGVMTDKPQ